MWREMIPSKTGRILKGCRPKKIGRLDWKTDAVSALFLIEGQIIICGGEINSKVLVRGQRNADLFGIESFGVSRKSLD